MTGLPLIWVGVYLCAQRMTGLPPIWVGVYLCAQRMTGLPPIWVGVYLCAQRMMGLPPIWVGVYLCAQRMMGLPPIWVGVYLCAQRMTGLPLIWVGVYLCAQRMMGLPPIWVGVYLCAQRMTGLPLIWVGVYLCAQRMMGLPLIWVGVYLCAQRMMGLPLIWVGVYLCTFKRMKALQDLIALLGEEDHQRSPAHQELDVHTDVENPLRSPAHREHGVHQDAENPLQQNEGPAAYNAPRGNTARRGRPPGRGLRSRVSTVTSDRVTRSRTQATRQQSSQSRGRPRRIASTTRGVSNASNVNRHERERRQQYDRNRRANMSAEQSQQIRSQDAQQHQNAVNFLSESDLQARRQTNAQQHRVAYNSLSDVDRQARIEQSSQRRQELFNSMSDAEHQNRQNDDAQRHRDAYNAMNDVDRQARQNRDAQQHRNAYQVPERGAAIAEQNLNRYHRGRATRRPSKAAILNAEGRLRYGIPEEDYLGGLTVRCSNCGAMHFPDEKSGSSTTFSDCCQNGKIKDWFQLRPVPEQLLKLFTDAFNQNANAFDKEQSKHFLKNLRHYNNALQCASLSYKSVSIPGHGPYVFKIQGITYHYTFNINQIREGELGQRNQLYILDTADQTAHRQTNARQYNHNLRPYILNVLKHCLDEANETYENLRRMFEMANVEEVAVAFAPVQPGRPNADRERLPEAREIVDEQDVIFRQALSDFMLHRKCGHENPQAVCMRSRKAPRYSPPAVAENAGQQPQQPQQPDPAQQAGQGNENANEQQNDDIVVPPPPNERQAEDSSSEEDDIDSFVIRDRPRNRAGNNQPTVDPPVDENENRELFEGENEFYDEDSFDQNVDDMFDRHFDFDPEGSIHVDTPPVIPENNVTGRSGYIQPREVCGKAMYRLFSLKTHFNSHAVIRLDVHLEERQQVYFADGQEAQVARPNRKTTLTAWFELNRRCREKFADLAPGAAVQPMSVHRYRTAQGEERTKEFLLSIDSRQFLYHEIPEHFVYDKIQVPCEYYFWKERQTKFGYDFTRLIAPPQNYTDEQIDETTDPEFREFLLQIGDGNFGDITLFTGVRTLRIPERYLSPYHRMEDIPRFVDEIYNGNTLLNPRQDQMFANDLSKSAILAATNEQVAMLNSVILNRMTSFSKVFYSTDSVVVERPENQHDVPIEHFHEANPPGIPPHELHLKEGCIVMLCRNWSVEDGLTNGTRLR
ncbi:hypothetical protein TYRP_020077, partial [Tyrophagus putrescentiae]